MNEEENKKEETSKTPWIKQYRTPLLIALVVIIIAIVYAVSSFSSTGGAVAKVNGESILQSEFDEHFKQELKGVDESDTEALVRIKKQIVEELIDNKLLSQAANKSGIEVTQEDIDAQTSLIEQQIGGRESFLKQLTELGIDEDKFKSDIKSQLIIQKYILENVDISSVSVTDDEVTSFYEKIKTTQDNVPPLSEIKQQIIDQITLEKQQELVMELIKSLRSSSNIEIL